MGEWCHEKIENKLRNTLQKIGSVIQVEMYSRSLGEYSVRLTNNHCLVVKLRGGTCSCKGWQLHGLPCVHAMAVIEK